MASTAAMVAAISCFVAMACFGPLDDRFFQFRFFLMNLAPTWFKKLYLRHGKRFALFIHDKALLRSVVKSILEFILLSCPRVESCGTL